MNSGSSALISTGGQSAVTLTSSSCSQMSRPAVHGHRIAGVAHDQHLVDALGLGERLVGVLLERHRPAAAQAFVGGDDELRIGVLDAAAEAVGREAAEHDRMHRADARAGEHRVGRLGDHRQVDGDAVALLDAVRLQHVGELADALVQLPVGDLLVAGRVIALPDDRDLVAALGEVAVDAVGADVERAVLVPFDRDVTRDRSSVLDLGVRLDPVDPLADLAPEAGGVVDRALVHLLVLRIVDKGLGGPLRGHCVDLLRHARAPPPGHCHCSIGCSHTRKPQARAGNRPLRRMPSIFRRPTLSQANLSDAQPADHGALDQQHAEPVAAVDQRQRRAARPGRRG